MSNKREQLEQGLGGSDKPVRAYQGMDDDVFAALDDQAVSSDVIPIMEIRADITQPRRIVPREIRGRWNGTPDGVPNLLNKWARAAGNPTVERIRKILTGEHSVHEHPWGESVTGQLANLLDLASQIYDVGLQQAIGVSTITSGYQIIFGERRWMAFHCLAHWIGEEWLTIPAKVAHLSEWELAKIQAGENFQREKITAIGEARQFAKLLMQARIHSGFGEYANWEDVVTEDRSELAYYEQVADGNLNGIPHGMGVEFEQAMGKNPSQLRRLRKLLRITEDVYINDALWMLADDKDWSEGFLRDISTYLEAPYINLALKSPESTEQILRDEITRIKVEKTLTESPPDITVNKPDVHEIVPTGTILDDEPVQQLPPNPVRPPMANVEERRELEERYMNKRVRLTTGKQGIVYEVTAFGLRVRMDDGVTALLDEHWIDSVIYIPGEADPETRQVKNPPKVEEDDYSSGEMDDYEAPAYLGDASDNAVSDDGDDYDLLDKQPMEVYRTLNNLMGLARQLNMADALEVAQTLFMLKRGDVEYMADLTEQDADTQLVEYESKIAKLLETAMQHVEHYTRWIREQVADERERE